MITDRNCYGELLSLDLDTMNNGKSVEQDLKKTPHTEPDADLPDVEHEPVSEMDTENENEEQVSVIDLEIQIAKLKDQLESAQDRSLRAQAEVENIRRRSTNEQINTRKFAIEKFASEMLAVKDSLDLARQVELTADNQSAIEKMNEGLSLTLKQLDSIFEKFSIEVIAPEQGEKLNPELHQAMTVQQTDEVENNCILTVIQKGYKLHERLLRPAMVVIARKPEEKNTGSNGTQA